MAHPLHKLVGAAAGFAASGLLATAMAFSPASAGEVSALTEELPQGSAWSHEWVPAGASAIFISGSAGSPEAIMWTSQVLVDLLEGDVEGITPRMVRVYVDGTSVTLGSSETVQVTVSHE